MVLSQIETEGHPRAYANKTPSTLPFEVQSHELNQSVNFKILEFDQLRH